MAKEKKQEFVQHITPREENFSQWYTDVVTQTDLMDYTPVRGCMALKPYGNRIWELIHEQLDAMFQETGHENVSMPMLIPESLLLKEADHVEGFAPEVAWVTQGGTEPLQERMAVRPTSETIFCTMFSKWVQSWRDLPLKYNQWCSVMRWEKTTRPFLRTAEFWWQEGHTVHATAEEAEEETRTMLGIYQRFCEENLAIPVYAGQKSDKEKFAGARATYSVEAMMQDGKALQMGTSHNLGDNFARSYNIMYLSREGKQEYCQTTSWGTSTRMIGGVIMVHGDDRGLMLPPRIAPYQAVIVPIAPHKAGVMDKAEEVFRALKAAGIRMKLDDTEQSAGWKFNQWEMKGVPVRIELGPKDIENNQAVLVRRDTHEKQFVSLDGLADTIKALLDDIHASMFNRALAHRESHTQEVRDFGDFMEAVKTGFAKAPWCGERECEDEIKAITGATTRCYTLDYDPEAHGDTCIFCGKKAKHLMYFGKAY